MSPNHAKSREFSETVPGVGTPWDTTPSRLPKAPSTTMPSASKQHSAGATSWRGLASRTSASEDPAGVGVDKCSTHGSPQFLVPAQMHFFVLSSKGICRHYKKLLKVGTSCSSYPKRVQRSPSTNRP